MLTEDPNKMFRIQVTKQNGEIEIITCPSSLSQNDYTFRERTKHPFQTFTQKKPLCIGGWAMSMW